MLKGRIYGGRDIRVAKLYFRYGTMNSGKSIDVLKTAHNYEEQGKKVILFSPAIDTRFGEGVIASRIGIQQKAFTIDPGTDIYEVTQREAPRCVLVDEAQFLSGEQVGQLCRIVDELGIPVIAYGLRADFQGKLFPGSYELLALADKIEEVKTICWYCEKKAIMNMRCKDGVPVFEGEQIQIGGNESYLPVCRKCYMTLKKKAASSGQMS
jgi:thymidine kinase